MSAVVPFPLFPLVKEAFRFARGVKINGVKDQIIEDWINHGKDWTKPGFRAVAVYRLGNWCLFRPFLLPKILWRPLYKVLSRRVRNHYGIEIPAVAKLGKGVIVEHQSAIVIHANCVIGDNCYIRQGVTIGMRHLNDADGVPVLGNGVDVGAGAKILGPIKIGDKARIGANAVVLKDVPANCTAVGIPARILPNRDAEE